MTTIPEQKTKEIVPEFKFHHLHMYCDELKSTEEYKKMEQHLNNFHKSCPYKEKGMDLENGRVWGELTGKQLTPVLIYHRVKIWSPNYYTA